MATNRQRFKKKNIYGQRQPGMGEECVGIEGPQWILVLEKKKKKIKMSCAGYGVCVRHVRREMHTPWTRGLYMPKFHIRYCGVVHETHVEK